jgi:hypothetical protein
VNWWACIARSALVVACATGACEAGRRDQANVAGEAGEADARVESPEPGSSPDASSSSDPASYRAVREIFERSCAYNRCHSGVPTGGALSLAPGSDYAAALVDVPSCEYPPLVRVKPRELEQSWLWIKLTAEVRPKSDAFYDYILFEPEPGWDETKRGCRDQLPDGTPLFGQRMPLTAPNLLPEAELAAVRDWILAGAPH